MIVHLVAYMSGWKRTAQEYAMQTGNEFPSDKIIFGSLQIGNSNYNNSVTIAIDSM
ncbi:MAG: hypothetical protein H6765_02810 [Candidatus Peribacteria bacterium]|nr:MAG: hypothetical protein H6765_02810 [Candidatus Peribacteria bacterium]